MNDPQHSPVEAAAEKTLDAGAGLSSPVRPRWNRAYEIRAVALLSIGFGLVGLDRFIIYPLFPVMAEDLGLTYQDLGLISGVLALTWGLSSIFSGNLSDRFGGKLVMVISVIGFSTLVGMSGLATGLISLLIIRAVMGFAEGGFVPASIVATVDASKPSRIGLNVGIQQMAAPLIGLGFGPLIAVGLLSVLPGWEWVFGVVAIPGFILAYFLMRTIRPHHVPPAATEPVHGRGASFWAPLKYRNIAFSIVGMFFLMSCLNILSTFMPSYLSDFVGLPLGQMGLVLSSVGVGGFIGMVVVPALSDRFGRKRIIVIALGIELVALATIVLMSKNPMVLAVCLFLVSFMNSGVVAIIVGPLIHETVPTAIAATATGFVVGLSEIVGGAAAPALTGMAAQSYGIEIIPRLALGAAVIATFIAAFGIEETSAGRPEESAPE